VPLPLPPPQPPGPIRARRCWPRPQPPRLRPKQRPPLTITPRHLRHRPHRQPRTQSNRTGPSVMEPSALSGKCTVSCYFIHSLVVIYCAICGIWSFLLKGKRIMVNLTLMLHCCRSGKWNPNPLGFQTCSNIYNTLSFLKDFWEGREKGRVYRLRIENNICMKFINFVKDKIWKRTDNSLFI